LICRAEYQRSDVTKIELLRSWRFSEISKMLQSDIREQPASNCGI
jgi:hypothetical protein